jgi:hypothetical protein
MKIETTPRIKAVKDVNEAYLKVVQNSTRELMT